MTRYLGYQATHWNKLSDHAVSRRFVEGVINRNLYRDWIADLTGAQFKVYAFIIARTLGWQKYAEAIPVRHFIDGVREADGSLHRDSDRIPVCSGTGIRKEDTVRAAIDHLRENNYITMFPGRRGSVTPANVFMPLAEDDLATFALRGGLQVLPEHLPRFFIGEHVMWRDGIFRVTGVDSQILRLRRVDRYGHDLEEKYSTASSEVERVRPDDWANFKKRD